METSFEKASKRLEEIVDELSAGSVTLEKTLLLYNEAAQLILSCRTMLDNARIKLEEISVCIDKTNGEENV
ncbi:MAG: exodeoxyribonuclease VII small subunit [Oscillospiraceae bacterium]